MIHSGKWIFIRYNPDKYIDKNGKRKNPGTATRLIKLEKEILKQIERIENGLRIIFWPEEEKVIEESAKEEKPSTPDDAVLETKELQNKVDEIIKKYGGYWEPLSMLARLTEEVGELSRAMNIKYGGKKVKFTGDGRDIEKEIADVIFTTFALANALKIDLDKEIKEKIDKDLDRNKGIYH